MTRATSPPAQVIVGLDAGTTGVKAVAFGLDAPWRRVVVREYPLLQPQPGWQVQDPGTIVAASVDALAECVAAVGAAEVVAIALSAAMHGLVGLDVAMRTVTPLITWADSRAQDEARSLRTSGQAADLHRRTGVPVHPMSPLTKLMWMSRNDPTTCASARWWVGLKDYLLWSLTGTLATELSSASGSGLLDMATRSWSPAAVDLAGIAVDQLPPIEPTTATLPLAAEPAARVGLSAGLPVVLGAADGPLGNLGTGAITPGVAGLSLGTSGAIRAAVDRPAVDDGGTLFCYALTDTTWVVGGAVSNGGIVLRWAGRSLAPDIQHVAGDTDVDRALLRLAEEVPAGSAGLVVLPYLVAERAPLWDPDLPGVVLGLRYEHTRAHLIRAALEGVCLQLRAVLDALDRLQRVQTIRATGGTLRAPLWRQVLAATLDRPLSLVGDAEGTALGAAALGLHALGREDRLADAVARLRDPDESPADEVEPDPALVATYERVRRSVPEHLTALAAVGALFSDDHERHDDEGLASGPSTPASLRPSDRE